MRRRRVLTMVAITLALLVACGDEDPAGPDLEVAVVEIDPATVTLAVGDTLRLVALPKTADGEVRGGVDVEWVTQSPERASIAPLGLHGRVTALRAGAVIITATVNGKTGQAEVAVENPAPAVLSLEPASAEAGSAGFELVVRGTGFSPDSRVHWNEAERTTTYVGTTELRAAIADEDLAAEGTANVRVISPAPGGGSSAATGFAVTAQAPPPVGPVATVEIAVDSLALEEGDQVQVSATARDANGTEVTGRFVQWTSSNGEVAPVGALGEVTAVRTGSATITARIDGRTASIPVRVSADYPYEVVFTAWSGVAGEALRLYAVDLSDSTGTPGAFGPNGAAGGPAVSPDGKRVAYLTLTGTQLREIRVANSDGSGDTRLLVTSDPSCGGMNWSLDGERIAFSCRINGDDLDIWVMDAADGANLVNLTEDHPGNQAMPSWSPRLADGSHRIAYEQYVSGEPQIWTMKDDGSDPKQLTAGLDMQPAWSPDGTTIAFQRTGVATYGDIYLVDADGGNERGFVGLYLPGPQWSPSWSPDGRFLAFASAHDTYGSGTTISQIYTVWADGSKLARRTSGPLDKHMPVWRLR